MRSSLNSWDRRRGAHFLSTILSLVGISCLLLISQVSCRYYKLEQKLDPENAEFISKVRYIITIKERKIFLDLPDSEKEEFKEEFWHRRDPDPETEENEFKMEYFNRLERATELFKGEAKPGWMTDRGRIYILFGPPMDRITYPGGSRVCSETWYYGNFPVVFIDENCSGNYQLVTYDLSSIRSLNLMYMHELSQAQYRAQQTIRGERKIINFNWKVKKTRIEADQIEGIVSIDFPYADIWFKSEEEKLVTTLEIQLELFNSRDEISWEHKESFLIEIDEEGLKKNIRKKYEIEIPFFLTKQLDRLRMGKNKFFISIKNLTGGDVHRKVMDFNLQ